jgi:hypothetical protein
MKFTHKESILKTVYNKEIAPKFMMTNKNCFKKIFFFSFRYLRMGDEIIAPQMGSCDEISHIWSFKKHVKTPTRSEKSA